MKKTLLSLILFSHLLLTACSNSTQDGVITSTDDVVTSITNSLNVSTSNYSSVQDETELTANIYFTDGDDILITESGIYEFSGDYSTSTVTVNVDKTIDKGIVYLILNNANIHSDTDTPIHIMEAKNVVILLASGSENLITQGSIVTDDIDFPSGAIYSKADTVISGNGTLTVATEYQDGINCRDDLIIDGATITVTAAEDGIVGKDLLQISESTITINSGKDGLKSSNDEDYDKGNIVINSGIFNILSSDDAIHSNNTIIINGGSYEISSTDDGIHADLYLQINDGTLNITDCYEGLEGGLAVEINDGTINIVSSDDSINVSDTQNGSIIINGGTIKINYYGNDSDGFDSNNNFIQTGGNIIIDKTNVGTSNQGAFDMDGNIYQTGGTIVDANGNNIDLSSFTGSDDKSKRNNKK